jgi:hypothetical protein
MKNIIIRNFITTKFYHNNNYIEIDKKELSNIVNNTQLPIPICRDYDTNNIVGYINSIRLAEHGKSITVEASIQKEFTDFSVYSIGWGLQLDNLEDNKWTDLVLVTSGLYVKSSLDNMDKSIYESIDTIA